MVSSLVILQKRYLPAPASSFQVSLYTLYFVVLFHCNPVPCPHVLSEVCLSVCRLKFVTPACSTPWSARPFDMTWPGLLLYEGYLSIWVWGCQLKGDAYKEMQCPVVSLLGSKNLNRVGESSRWVLDPTGHLVYTKNKCKELLYMQPGIYTTKCINVELDRSL